MKTRRKPRLTIREKLAIVCEAIRLIRNPEHWTTGYWKKVIDYKKDYTPIYAYCLDGAVNQATVNVLGLPRAITLGAALPSQ